MMSCWLAATKAINRKIDLTENHFNFQVREVFKKLKTFIYYFHFIYFLQFLTKFNIFPVNFIKIIREL